MEEFIIQRVQVSSINDITSWVGWFVETPTPTQIKDAIALDMNSLTDTVT